MNKPLLLQESFLNNARKERTNVSVRLTDGLEISGTVRGFDNFTLILEGENGRQSLLYKHAIAAVRPASAIG